MLKLKRDPKFPARPPRTISDIPTRLLCEPDTEVSVRVTNLSDRGCCAEFSEHTDLHPGTCLGVDLRDRGIVRGQIRWIEENRVGIMFERPIPFS